MAVISLGKRWPNARVPYEAGSSSIESWLIEINTVAKLDIFVPREDSDSDYLSAKSGNGKSEAIGYVPNCGEYRISAQRKQSMQHEALHALGFHHEQLHSGGPWGAFGLKATSASMIWDKVLEAWGRQMGNPSSSSTRRPNPPRRRERRASITSGIRPEVEINEAAIKAHKDSYDAALADNGVMHILSCDFDSVMMYSQMRAAVEEVGGVKMVKTGKPAGSDHLSNGEIQALRYMYNTCTTVAEYRPLTFA